MSCMEPQRGKDAEDSRDSKDSRDIKEFRDYKDTRDIKEFRDSRDTQILLSRLSFGVSPSLLSPHLPLAILP